MARPRLTDTERSGRARAVLDAAAAIEDERDTSFTNEMAYVRTWADARALAEAYPTTITDRDLARHLGWTVRQVKAAREADPTAFRTDAALRRRPPPEARAVMAALADELGIPRSRISVILRVDPRTLPSGGLVYERMRELVRSRGRSG